MPPEVAPLDLRLAPSLRLAALLVALHALGAAAMALSDLPWALKAALAALLAASLTSALRTHVWPRGAGAIVALRVSGDRTAVVLTRSGELIPGDVLPESLVHPAAVILRLATERGARTAIIFPDAVDADAFRRLRVLLRWGRAEADPAGPESSSG